MGINSIKFSLPTGISEAVDAELRRAKDENKVARIWKKDASVWTNDDESKWLGWLNIVDAELHDLQKYRNVQTDLAGTEFDDVLLLGMGGSSLCPEVLAITFGKTTFHILDSTIPAQVKAVDEKIDVARTLFIVASKSGSTLEPNCFKQYFFERVSEKVGADKAGKQFIAITDPGSKMEQVAKADGFRYIFYGNPQIGGRFSALSVFGMVAAASMGIDVEKFLYDAAEMVEACKNEDPTQNPGAVLGTVLGICHKYGRDKLTIFTSPEIHDLGAWLEQLIAESTGKDGVAIIPVDREPFVPADHYRDDRVFVYLDVSSPHVSKGSVDDSLNIALHAIEAAEHPVIRITLHGIENLGQEFFRWEFATAVAGSIMQINPFNQPDVEAAKIEARKLTDQYEQTGSLPAETPFFEENDISLFSSDEYAGELKGLVDEESLAAFLEAHVLNAETPDYFAILAYIAMKSENEELLRELRGKILEQTEVATCLGFGPRFLHSTGQAYKGGGNNGVFLQVTSDDEFDISVPGQKYTFGIVKAAQARGDFRVLLDRGRRALRVHIGGGMTVREGLETINGSLS
jgi:transaldolase/glucose-6-phosphate isomerase